MAQSLHKELYPITILKMVSYSQAQAHCHKYIATLEHAPICVVESGARSQVKVIIIYKFLLGARYNRACMYGTGLGCYTIYAVGNMHPHNMQQSSVHSFYACIMTNLLFVEVEIVHAYIILPLTSPMRAHTE